MTITIITVSDRARRGEYEDLSGPRIKELLREAYPDAVVSRALSSDDRAELESVLSAAMRGDLLQSAQVSLGHPLETAVPDFIITTGGTGLGPRDNTPEVTRSLCDRELPGIAETIRAESYRETPMAMLSRAYAGMAGDTIVVNLPGSVKAVETGTRVLVPVMAHALRMRHGGGH